MSNTEKLTPKQQMFCEYYAVSGNGTDACDKAGYGGNNLAVQASKLLRLPKIQDEINHLRANALEKVRSEQVNVMLLLSNIACEENEHKYNVNARLKALELIGKAQGIFIEKKQVISESQISIHNPSELSDAELEQLLEKLESENKILEMN